LRIAGVAMIRNEADLVEAFVRHHLARVDVLYVVDHRSEDGTREILGALRAEGLSLVLSVDDDPRQRQPETIGALARAAFAAGAGVVLPLDGDEFLKLPDRVAFERWLGALPPGLCAALDWQSYVPDPQPAGAHPLAAARRRRVREAHGLHKVVLTRAFADAPAAVLGPGNHAVLLAGPAQNLVRDPVRLARVPPAIAALAHLPVRNASQLAAKIALGWRAHVAAGREDPTLAFHWAELYAELARGLPASARLREIACNYGVAMARWEPAAAVELVDDPLPADVPLRYRALARPLAVTF
jgi:hypothetical protein